MNIVDLTEEHLPTFLACLKDWCDEQKSGGEHKEAWWRRMRDKGLRVKLAQDNDGAIVGMIQYLPIEYSCAEGHVLYYIQCIWVHGYAEGIGNRQGRGAGTLLLGAAEQDAHALGAKGMAAWGMDFPYWFPVTWYLANGYEEADKNGQAVLAWKAFADDAAPPKWITPTGKAPTLTPGKLTVTALFSPWCQDACVRFEQGRRAAAGSFGDRVVVDMVDTTDPTTLREWGEDNAILIDGEPLAWAPDLDEEKIKQTIGTKLEEKL
ncbi:MAG: GNAT family N-acetyltransferase [Verrucomicrobia bacterium]|nr:GNAT family N-acetyltransferase [Verrucomicrobiota bacterium]